MDLTSILKGVLMDKLTCEYCGKVKDEVIFIIGASSKPDWCMHAGTGKMSCPDCYDIAQKEATERIDAHIKAHNEAVEASQGGTRITRR